jgi:hypothetical protein
MSSVGSAEGEQLETRRLALAAAARSQRVSNLRARETHVSTEGDAPTLRKLPTREDRSVDWDRAARNPLFVATRAKTLADLLFSRRTREAEIRCRLLCGSELAVIS